MDILKKTLMTVVAAMSLIMFAACNFEVKADDSNSVPQKGDPKKEIAATYTNNDAAMFGLEMKIDFYTDGTWLAYDDVQSMVIVDLYKGTYEGTASKDGTVKIKITDYSDAAKVIEDNNLAALLAELESSIDPNATELPVKYNVVWTAYENPEEKSNSIKDGTLKLFNADFIRNGYTSGEAEPEAPIVDPKPEDGSDKDEKTVVATYISKKDAVTGLIMKVDFYSDGSWLAYDDIHVGEGYSDTNGNTITKESSALYVDLYKGTYKGKPAEDGELTIVETHNTVISNLRGKSKYNTDVQNQLEQLDKNTVLPVRYTDMWLASANVENNVSVKDGKITLYETTLYKDGKFGEEPVARFFGQDDFGKVVIDLYDDGSFLAYDEISFGNGISMLLDLYKGSYEGKPAEDGNISFNITHVSTMLGLSDAEQYALMEAQLAQADENTVYPVKFKGEWTEIATSATVTVQNGRTNVLGFDVVREGIPNDLPLFESTDCTVPVESVELSDGTWTMKLVDNKTEVRKNISLEEKEELLNYFSDKKDIVESYITEEVDVVIPVKKMVQCVSYKMDLKNAQVTDVKEVSAYSIIIVEDSSLRDVIDYIAVNYLHTNYEWSGETGLYTQILTDQDLVGMGAMGQSMLEQTIKTGDWKSNIDSSKFYAERSGMIDYLAKE